MNRRLDHEKLEVYQASLVFIAWLEPIRQILPGKDGPWSIVSMRVGSIKANSDYRLHEGNTE